MDCATNRASLTCLKLLIKSSVASPTGKLLQRLQGIGNSAAAPGKQVRGVDPVGTEAGVSERADDALGRAPLAAALEQLKVDLD